MAVAYFIMGCYWGSFNYWLCERLMKGGSIWQKRSVCDNCQESLRFYELVPILSQLYYRSACPRCQQVYSKLYLGTELVSGLVFLSYYYSSKWSATAGLDALVLILLLSMTYCDWIDYWVPDCFQVLLFAAALFRAYQLPITFFHLLYVGLVAIILFLIYYLRSNWIGGGDIKLLITLSLLVDPILYPYLLLIASASALVVMGARYLLTKQASDRLAFVPFISLAYLTLTLVGPWIKGLML